ncbi:MAG TPA: hypothetical protein VJ720_12190, partial [Chitinophaga sp.]|nr:hypothetical protein [Chitinophaga sp.]
MRLVIALLLLTGNRVLATPECPIITARFPVADGTTADNSSTGWYLDASKIAGTGYFAVKSNRLHAQELGGEGIWYSKVFSTSGYTDWQFAVKISSEGDMNTSEYVKIYYKVNGGAETLLDQRTGNFGTIDFTSPLLNGNNIQIIVKIYNYNNGGSQTSKYYIEEYRVFKEKGPCAGTIPVTATAANGGLLTCSNGSTTLSASSTATNVSYSWTGPNNFTSTSQNPVVNVAGTYTVVATNSSGSGSATVTVTANKNQPDLSATGGTLACGNSVTLNASSSVSNVSYSWTGPNNFSNNTKSPVVSTVGTYNVTITNPANGCTNSASVSVTSGSATPTDTWVEDFSLANGTTTDNGTTAWSVQYPSGALFSVNNNIFRASGTGTTTPAVWTSGTISISGKTNVNISAGIRSAITGDAVMNGEDGTYGDYVRFYYKLNGGSEVLFAEKKGIINNHSTSLTGISVAGLSGSTLQIIIKVKVTGTDEFYYIDNIKVNAIDPSLTLATAVSGPVTCTSGAQITVTPSATVASYSWTGPNGFTSTLQNPVVTAGGQYVVTATTSGGCTVSAPVTVTENKAIPDLQATGGVLGCATSVVLNASSSVANAQYSWTGPNGFTNTSKNPSVNTIGTYVVTVKDPANGCTNSASVSVTSGTGTVTNTWLEDFTLANGTTTDNGTTAWSVQYPSGSLFSVNSNIFRASGTGTTTPAVWTSGVISIAGKTNVSISAGARSSITGDAVMNGEDGTYGDYIRFYYKLNGGAEVLFAEKKGIINNHSTSLTGVSISGLSGVSLQIVVRVKVTGTDEFYYFDNMKVTAVDSALTLTTAVGGPVTCAGGTQIIVTPSTSVSSYSWTGPNGFTSTLQNPVVNAGGQYIVTATSSGGCTVSVPVTVTEDKAIPDLTATGGTIGCSSAATLNASSSVANAEYSWTGPGGFTSNSRNPSVNTVGTYTVTVKNPANGCTASATAEVTTVSVTPTTFWLEDFTLANGTTVDNGTTSWSLTSSGSGTASVQSNEFKVSYSGAGEARWASGVIDISGKKDVVISAFLKSQTASTNDAFESDDYIRVYYKLNGGAEVLVFEDMSGIGTTTTGTASTTFNSNAINGSTLQVVIRARNSDPTERYYFDDVKLTGAANTSGNMTATASVNGALSCSITSVQLSGSSNTSGVSYKWSGPGGFSSNAQNPAVTAGGAYILTVTNSTGCTANATVTVIQDITAPDLSIAASGTLSCSTTGVTLTASSNTANVAFTWTGRPAGQNPISVTAPGKYYVTATAANGCSKSDSITVTQSTGGSGSTPTTFWLEDFTLANGTTSDNGATSWTVENGGAGTASVQNNEFKVSYSTPVEARWVSGVIDISGKENVTISADLKSETPNNDQFESDDYINVYYKLNGGEEVLIYGDAAGIGESISGTSLISFSSAAINGNTLQIVVRARNSNTTERYYFDNIRLIGADKVNNNSLIATASVSDTIRCKTPVVQLFGGANTLGVEYSWSGPLDFSSNIQNPGTTTPGTYTLTVTTPSGCVANASVTVIEDKVAPGVSVSASGPITCAAPSVVITGVSPVEGVTYSWEGTNNFTSVLQSPAVSIPGLYILTVRSPKNGCVSEGRVIVQQDIATPDLTIVTPAVLNCNTTSVNLTASSTTANTTITWTGRTPGQSQISVTAPGKYYVTATSANGCKKTDSVTVTQDVVAPNLTIATPAALTCSTTSVNLTASSTTANTTFTWSGRPDGLNPITVNAPGKYYVTATSANGCEKTDSVTVTQNLTAPNLSIATPATLTCSTTSVNLTASSTTAGVSFTWTGRTAGQNPVSVTAPGKYYVTATTANGCSKQDSVTVSQDITIPNLSVSIPAVLTCNATSVNLTASSTTAGTTFTWTGRTAGQNPISVTAPGKYYVTATTANGCIKKDSVTVSQNIDVPNLSIATPATLTCSTTSVNLTASSTT